MSPHWVHINQLFYNQLIIYLQKNIGTYIKISLIIHAIASISIRIQILKLFRSYRNDKENKQIKYLKIIEKSDHLEVMRKTVILGPVIITYRDIVKVCENSNL